jgi:hypothetical protein
MIFLQTGFNPMPRRKINNTKLDLLVDILIFLMFLVSTDPRATGVPIHEWLGTAFGAAILIHLLLHWKWIVNVVRRFFSKLPDQTRINSLLNILLFIDATLLVFTGLLISRVVLAPLGLTPSRDFFWRWLHNFATDAGVIIVGLHLALHWKWIVNAFKRYFMQPLVNLGRRAQPEPVAVAEQDHEVAQ